MTVEPDPLLLTELTSEGVRDYLDRDTRLIVPIGTCDQYGPHLPIGATVLVADAFARRLSRDCSILRAPPLPFGVSVPTEIPFAGRTTVREKTLHGFLNDLFISWDDAGFSEFVLLTVHDYDSHVEAIATVTGRSARIRVIEALNIDFTGMLDRPSPIEHGGEALTSLMLFLYPDKVRMDRAVDFAPDDSSLSTLRHLTRIPAGSPGSIGYPTLASAEKGRLLFDHICERIRSRVLAYPTSSPE